jgi:hypothetical protein
MIMPKLLDSMIPPIINEHLERCARQPTIFNQAAVSNRRFGNPCTTFLPLAALRGENMAEFGCVFFTPTGSNCILN